MGEFKDKKLVEKKEVIIGKEVTNAGDKEHFTITDAETGEILNSYWKVKQDRLSGRPPKKKDKDLSRSHFFKIYRTNWVNLVKKKKLTMYEFGLFAQLMAYVDWQSPYLVHPRTKENMNESEIAGQLDMDRTHIHNSLMALCDKGLIAKVNKGRGRPSHFMLNTNVVFYGSQIKDINDHITFIKDCAYQPKVLLRYNECSDSKDCKKK